MERVKYKAEALGIYTQDIQVWDVVKTFIRLKNLIALLEEGICIFIK